MNFMKIVHDLREMNKYLELKFDEVCKKVEVMSRPKTCTPGNTDNIPPLTEVKVG